MTDESLDVSFRDVNPSKWYANAIAIASREGLIQSDGVNEFRPDEGITREEVAVMLMAETRYVNNQVGEISSADLSPYKDANDVSPWARQAVAEAIEIGLLHGNDQALLLPNEAATRAEATALLERMLRLIGFIN